MHIQKITPFCAFKTLTGMAVSLSFFCIRANACQPRGGKEAAIMDQANATTPSGDVYYKLVSFRGTFLPWL